MPVVFNKKKIQNPYFKVIGYNLHRAEVVKNN